MDGVEAGQLGQLRRGGVNFALGSGLGQAGVHLVQIIQRGGIAGDEPVLEALVVRAKKQDARGGEAIAPGPPGFLVVGLDGGGQVVVDDGADIGLVHAHAKGVGGHHYFEAVSHKIGLHPMALVGVQPGVVGGGGLF